MLLMCLRASGGLLGPHSTLGEASAIEIVLYGWETEAQDDVYEFLEGLYGKAST